MRIWRVLGAVLLTGACEEAASPELPVAVVPSMLQLRVRDTARVATSDARVRVTWRSAFPAVATVDAGGLVTALAPGKAAVWAVRGADSAAVNVTVITIICTGTPTISPPNAVLVVGDTLRVATSLTSGCSAITGPIEWSASDAAIATITPRGAEGASSRAVITARRAGQAVITARSVEDPTTSASMALTVSSP